MTITVSTSDFAQGKGINGMFILCCGRLGEDIIEALRGYA
jgi:hypothetical protein